MFGLQLNHPPTDMRSVPVGGQKLLRNVPVSATKKTRSSFSESRHELGGLTRTPKTACQRATASADIATDLLESQDERFEV